MHDVYWIKSHKEVLPQDLCNWRVAVRTSGMRYIIAEKTSVQSVCGEHMRFFFRVFYVISLRINQIPLPKVMNVFSTDRLKTSLKTRIFHVDLMELW